MRYTLRTLKTSSLGEALETRHAAKQAHDRERNLNITTTMHEQPDESMNNDHTD